MTTKQSEVYNVLENVLDRAMIDAKITILEGFIDAIEQMQSEITDALEERSKEDIIKDAMIRS